MEHINLLIKPNNACNLDCSYCFQNKGQDKLSIGDFVHLVEMAIKVSNSVHVLIHGGEPLLNGIDYYKELFEQLEIYYESDDIDLNYSLQTNGTLLNHDWIDLFNTYDVGISTSYDGLDSERPLADKVLEKVNTYKLPFITVLHNGNLPHAIQIYEELKNTTNVENFCMNLGYDNAKVSPDGYENYLKLLEYILTDTKNPRTESNLTNWLTKLCGGTSTLCTVGCSLQWLTMDADTRLYACDRDVSIVSPIKLSDIQEIDDFYISDYYEHHILRAYHTYNECSSCKFSEYCVNKCPNGHDCSLNKQIIKRLSDYILNHKITNPHYLSLLGIQNER